MPETLQRPAIPVKVSHESTASLYVRLTVAVQSGVGAFVDQWKRAAAVPNEAYETAMTEGDYKALLDTAYAGAREKIVAMNSLESGWNSYRAAKIGDRAIAAALRLLEVLQPQSMPAPEVGPTPDGGVQLAWSLPDKRGQLELELTVFDNDVEYSFGFRDEVGFIETGRVKALEDAASKLRGVMNPAVAA